MAVYEQLWGQPDCTDVCNEWRVNPIDPDLQVHILSALNGRKLTIVPLRRLLQALNVPYANSESFRSLHNNPRLYINMLRKGMRVERAQQDVNKKRMMPRLPGNQEDYPDAKPGFIAYDDACSLLRYIVTQNPNSTWLSTTKFIVDAWHYIGHRATDILCRIWCNPAPVNGSQPDLVVVQQDANGTNHQTRAFNTETAEQLNSWLSGFESQLRQMSDVNYDFFIHVLMLIYSERVEKRIAAEGLELSEEFWMEATGN
ncbi:hypothetical protein B0H13DRAFT_1922822 [Mycena leptocephala]|nr:hypothetical protein B0H13DRAFT_1922822 [Mycena leptocephala]